MYHYFIEIREIDLYEYRNRKRSENNVIVIIGIRNKILLSVITSFSFKISKNQISEINVNLIISYCF